MVAKTANEIWRDFETDGVASSGAHKPIKSDIRAWGTQFELLGGINSPGADTSAALFSAGVGVAAAWRRAVGFDLPNPSTTVPGVVFSKPAAANQVLSGLETDGTFSAIPAVGTGNVVLDTNPIIDGTLFFKPFVAFAAAPAGNNIIYGPDGRLALQFQTPNAFYKSDNHFFGNHDGSQTYWAFENFRSTFTPRALANLETLTCFQITQTWDTGAGLGGGFVQAGVDFQFKVISTHPSSKTFRIRSGPAGTIEMFGISADITNPVLFIRGRAIISAPLGNPTTFYSGIGIGGPPNPGTAFGNAAGSKYITQFSDTGVWSFVGNTSGTHTLAAQENASGASTFPNNSGELLNTGTGFISGAFGVAVDLNVANVDIPVPLKIPSGSTRFRFSAAFINTGPGAASITTAQIAIYTAPSAGGTALCLPQAMAGLTSNSPGVPGTYINLAVNPAVGSLHWFDIATVSTVYVRVTTAQGAAAAGRCIIFCNQLP